MFIMIDVLYYQYYHFYKRVLADPDPHVATILSLSFLETLALFRVASYSLIYLCCYNESWVMIAIAGPILLFNFLYYQYKDNSKRILNESPKFLNSHGLTLVLVLIMSVILMSSLIWGTVHDKMLLKNC